MRYGDFKSLLETFYDVKGHSVTKADPKKSSAIMAQHKDLNEPANTHITPKHLDAVKKQAEKNTRPEIDDYLKRRAAELEHHKKSFDRLKSRSKIKPVK